MDFAKFTKNSQTAILNTKELLKNLDHSSADPEHIIASIFLLEDIDNSHLAKVLQELKINIATLSLRLREELKKKPKGSAVLASQDQLNISVSTQSFLEQAIKISEKMKNWVKNIKIHISPPTIISTVWSIITFSKGSNCVCRSSNEALNFFSCSN